MHNEEILKQNLKEIDFLYKEQKFDAVCNLYLECVSSFENSDNNLSNTLKGEVYKKFAYFLFDICEYEQSLLMFSKVLLNNVDKEEIRRFIYKTFVEPNLHEFRENYNTNTKILTNNNCIQNYVAYEKLDFWLIPTEVEQLYYLYNTRDDIIETKIKLSYDHKKEVILLEEDKFADYIILSDWNVGKIVQYKNKIEHKNKKTYAVITEYNKFLSLLQSDSKIINELNNITIFDGFYNMEKYLKESDKYLPRNIVDLINERYKAVETINKIHNYRISADNSKNIILSICIPTYNRGKRAYENVLHTLLSNYDNEIEIVISNNGTQNDTVEWYEKIKNINDTRVKYFEFEDNVGFALNVCNVVNMAEGKYVVIISDEDIIDINLLDKILGLLVKNNIGVIRTKGQNQGFIPSTKLCSKGESAILTYMLTSNYMSGIIFNNELLKKYKCTEYVEKRLDNEVCLYYPHMLWEVILSQYADVKGEDVTFIIEGEAEKTDIGRETNEVIPLYSSIEGRIKQFEGYYQIFNDMDICKSDFELIRKMYRKLVEKYMLLTMLSINVFYKKLNTNVLDILNKMYDLSLEYLDKLYECNKKKSTYKEDKIFIEHIYINCRKSLGV